MRVEAHEGGSSHGSDCSVECGGEGSPRHEPEILGRTSPAPPGEPGWCPCTMGTGLRRRPLHFEASSPQALHKVCCCPPRYGLPTAQLGNCRISRLDQVGSGRVAQRPYRRSECFIHRRRLESKVHRHSHESNHAPGNANFPPLGELCMPERDPLLTEAIPPAREAACGFCSVVSRLHPPSRVYSALDATGTLTKVGRQ